jgi:hypothetical protein
MLQLHTQINKRFVEPMLKPMQVDRKLVKVRKLIYKIMAQPIRFDNVELSTRKVDFVNHHGQLQTSKLEGRITTRIEKYANKTRVLVFTNVDENYGKPYKKTMLY